MNNLTDIFIRKPVFATVLSLLILLIGIISFTKLTVRQYPKIDASAVTITTTYPGASAELMEGFITNPIENALSGVDGIDYITSTNTLNQSQITVHFNLSSNIDTAAADISSKVESARSNLPQDINAPIIAKMDPNEQPAVYIGFTSTTRNGEAITNYVTHVIKPQIATLPGVGQSDIYGNDYAMRIWLNPYLMAAHNVTIADVSNALATNNTQSPTGYIKTPSSQINVNAATDLSTATQFNNLVIKNDGGQPVSIKDVGYATLGPQAEKFSALINNKNAIVMAVTPQPTANPLDVSNVVKTALARIQNQLPSDLHAHVDWDNSKFIVASIAEVKKSIFEAAFAVLLVMFLFLGSLRVLVIPAITIPLSLIGVFALMLGFGFTINTLTLLAMVLAIGMVVDDSIVVTENIHRHMEKGEGAFAAAINGAREIKFAVIAMTFTLAAVFAPIGFLSDITGALFKEFAFTLASAVIISGFIALTLSPMMCSKLLVHQAKSSRFSHFIDGFFAKIVGFYRHLLNSVTSHLRWVGLAVVAIIFSAVLLYRSMPHELAPAEDIGGILTVMTGPSSANLAYIEKYSKELIPIYNSIPEKDAYAIFNGAQNINSAMSFLILKPWNERHRSAQQIIQTMLPKMMQIPGVQAFPMNPFSLPGSDDFTPLSFVLKTTGSYEQLAETSKKIIEKMAQNPGFVNPNSDLKFDQPQLNVAIDRNKAADLGINMGDLGQAINFALGEPTAGHFSMNGSSYYVIPQLAPEFMDSTDAINNINVRSGSGALVPLANLVTTTEMTAPENLTHFQQQRAVTITANLAPNYTLDQAINWLQATAKKTMPENTTYDFGGTSRQFLQASHGSFQTFIFALLFIALILAAQFESFLDPFIVLFSVIPAITGALLTLKLAGGTINIYTQIGLVTLIGLISKHGILMVEFANQLQKQGIAVKEAIITAATTRFRPILMTTMAMVLGAIPLALATGAGALSRQQIGWVIAGGMLFGTCVTLFVVPCAYIAVNKISKRRFISEAALVGNFAEKESVE